MNVLFERSFEKDLKRIRDKKIRSKVKAVIELVKNADNHQQIHDLKQLRNHKTYYRIRMGNYRLGIEIIENKVIFTRCLHRKDIYKYFP